MASYRQSLPKVAAYRDELIAAGAGYPLPNVPIPATGLLDRLPPPSKGRRGWPWDLQAPFVHGDPHDWPPITVAMPSFNQADYLEEAIRSVLLQNYPRLEFIVMDGGSSDGSAEIIEKYRPWLSFGRSAKDRGQAHALNLAFSLSSADLVGWLNSDDLYLPHTLCTAARAARSGAQFIHGDVVEIDESATTMRYLYAPVAKARYVRWGGLVFQPTAFWSRSKHHALWEEQWCALDYELWVRLLPGLRIHYTASAMAVARKHDLAKTYDPDLKQRWDADAERNGLAHPELYQDNLMNRCIAGEYRVVQRIARAWRGRRIAERLADVMQACRWTSASTPSR